MKKNEKIKDDIDRKCHKVKKIKELKPLVLDKTPLVSRSIGVGTTTVRYIDNCT